MSVLLVTICGVGSVTFKVKENVAEYFHLTIVVTPLLDEVINVKPLAECPVLEVQFILLHCFLLSQFLFCAIKNKNRD